MHIRITGALFAATLLPAALHAERYGFTRDVQPIFVAKCQGCHGGDKRSGGFTIREYGEMLHSGRSGAPVLPGDSKQSLLMQRLSGEHQPTMPLGAPPLSAKELEVVASWIDQGARLTPDADPAKPRWTPSLTLAAPPVPSGQGLDWLVGKYLDKHGVKTPAPVSDAAFLRRAYLDVWGLLPSPNELDEFQSSTDPGKRAKLVDRLLSNNRNYSEHWISFWNDLLRNDGGDSYHGGRKSITDWLYRSLDSNLPYNQFVTQLLNPVGPQAPDGFLMGVNWRGDVNASQLPIMQAAQNSAQIFLGINLKCNSCHDSFISHWKLKDAYGLAAYFSEQPRLELVRCDNPTGQFTNASFLYPELNAPADSLTLPERHALVARMFTDPRNGRTPRTLVNRYWQRLLGRGIVLDVDDMDAEPWDPQLLDWLAADFVANGYDLKHLLRTIMTSQAYQMPAVTRTGAAEKEYVFRGPDYRRVTAEQMIDAIGSITGEWQIAPVPGKQLGAYSRDWKVPSSTLSRALGRPIRDQVYTERDESSTTLQELELVNGNVLAHLLQRGSQRLLGELPPSPANLFDSDRLSSQHVAVDIDISKLNELHLVAADVGSYSPERVLPVWADASVQKDGAWIPLPESKSEPVQMKGIAFPGGIRTKLPSDLVFDLRGKGYTRFRATVGLEEKCLQSDISAAVRFFVFGEKPDFEHLVKVGPETPAPTPAAVANPDQLITRIWKQALGRDATPAERKMARKTLKEPGGLADLLWSVLMLPEFQLIG